MSIFPRFFRHSLGDILSKEGLNLINRQASLTHRDATVLYGVERVFVALLVVCDAVNLLAQVISLVLLLPGCPRDTIVPTLHGHAYGLLQSEFHP